MCTHVRLSHRKEGVHTAGLTQARRALRPAWFLILRCSLHRDATRDASSVNLHFMYFWAYFVNLALQNLTGEVGVLRLLCASPRSLPWAVPAPAPQASP